MNTNITLLGISKAGKTNFILEAIKDINSFSPQITITPLMSMQPIDDKEIHNNQYLLKVSESMQWNFSLCDYEGNLLKSNRNYGELIDVLYSSDTWIILIDGANFEDAEEPDEQIIGRIKRSSARLFIPYISGYAEEHNEIMPELLFVITKAYKFANKFVQSRIKCIIMDSFEGIFTKESSPMIMLCETSCTKVAGLAVLALFYIRYVREISDSISQLESRNEQIQRDISGLQNMIYEIENQKILGKLPANKRRLESYRGQIYSLKTESSNNRAKIMQYRNDTGLQYLGTCVQCLIDNNQQMIVNGFDRINYQYDKPSAVEIQSHIGVKVVLGFNLFMLCLVQILVKLSALSEINRQWMTIGYVAWFLLSIVLAITFDKRRKKHYVLQFSNDIVRFFYTKAKEKE